MNNESQQTDGLDRQILAALERKPEPRVPADFASRLAARAAALPLPSPRQAISYGRAAALTCALLLVVAMFVVAPWSQPQFRSVAFDMELVLLAQVVGIGGWLTMRRRA